MSFFNLLIFLFMFYILIFFQCVFSKMFAGTVGAPKCFIPWPKWYNWQLFPWISPWFFFDTIGCGINNLLQFSVHITFFLSFISNLKAFSRCSHDWFINIDTFLSLMCVCVCIQKNLLWLRSFRITACEVYNLGTGKGTSVLEMVAAFEKASGKVLSFYKYPCYDLVHFIKLFCFIVLSSFVASALISLLFLVLSVYWKRRTIAFGCLIYFRM